MLARAHGNERLSLAHLSPDGLIVYFTVHSDSAPTRYLKIYRGGRSPTEAGPSEFMLSPDGTKSARLDTVGYDIEPNAVVVRDLLTGSEKAWRRPGSFHVGGLYLDGWLPDSKQFLFGECGADPPCGLGVIDSASPPGRLPGSGLGWNDDPPWDSTVERGRDRMAAVAYRDTDTHYWTALYELDVDTLDLGDKIIKTRSRGAYDFDRTGAHLLFIHSRKGTLVRWHGGERIPVRDGVRLALW